MTTTNLTSDEREQRLRDIRRARELGILPWSHLSSPTQQFEVARDTIDFLLFLLDNQAKGVSTDMAVLSGYESGLADAATRMRDKCVGKVKLLAESWARSVGDQWDERPDLSFDAAERVKAAGEIVCALESLTLDQVEQEK